MDELKPLSIDQYLRTFGAKDNEGDWAGVDTTVMHPLGKFTREGQQRDRLRAIQSGILQGYEDYIKKFNAQHIKQMMAPTYGEATAAFPGVKELAPKVRTRIPDSLQPAPGSREAGQPRPMYADLATMGFAERTPTALPVPPGVLYAETPDLSAKLSPFAANVVGQLADQASVISPEGVVEPTALHKPRVDLMTPEEYQFGLKQLGAAGFLPEGQTAETMPVPGMAIPRAEATQYFNNLAVQGRIASNDRTTLNRIAQSAPWALKDYASATPDQKAQIIKKYSELNPFAYQNALMAQPVAADKAANIFDRKAFIEKGELVPRLGLSEGQSRSPEHLHISDKNLEQFTEVEKSASSLGQIFEYSDQIITATDTTRAALERAKYLANQNVATRMLPGVYDASMVTYGDLLEALSNGLSKAFGGERGVLTNVDVKRWVNAMPAPGDTVEVKEMKKAALTKLVQAASIAQRRAIAGDMGEVKKLRDELHKQTVALLSPLDKVSPKATDDFLKSLPPLKK